MITCSICNVTSHDGSCDCGAPLWPRQDPRDALIKQLGEALSKALIVVRRERDLYDAEINAVNEADDAYNNYLRERGE